MNKADNQIIALPFLEFLRRIQREAGLLGNGARSLEWIHQRLQCSKSIREKAVLCDQIIWILKEVSPQLISTSWPSKFGHLSVGKRLDQQLQGMSNASNISDWIPGTVGCMLLERGSDNGFVRKLRFSHRYDRTHTTDAHLGPKATKTVKNIFQLLSGLDSINFRYGCKGIQYGFEDTCDIQTEVDGASLGFSTALGIVSLSIEKELSQVFASGALDQGGKAQPVTHVIEKVESVFREWPNLSRVVLPAVNRKDLKGNLDKRIFFVSDLEELIEVCFGSLHHFVVDDRPMEAKLYEIQNLCKSERKPVLGMKAAKRFIKQYSGRRNLYERFQAGWYLVDCLIHVGRLDEASGVLSTIERQAKSLLARRRIRPVDYLRVRMNRSRIHWGRFNYQASIRNLKKLIEEMHELIALGEEEALLYGTLGQVLTHAGRFSEAEQALLKARLLIRDNPDEIPRECMLLGDLYRRMDDLGKSNSTLKRAENLNRRAPTKSIRHQNQIYIHLAKARLARAQKQWQQVKREARKGLSLKPQYHPRCLLERELGVALWQIGDQITSAEILSKTAASDDSCSYDALAKIIGNTSALELIILLSVNEPDRAAKVAQAASKSVQSYKPLVTLGKRSFRIISQSARKIETSEETDQAASVLAREASVLLGLIAW